MKRIFDDGRGPRRALRAEPVHHRLRRGRLDGADHRARLGRHGRRHARRRGRPARPGTRGVAHPMKVAYWPGCVSRGFTPELHGSMAKIAPLLDLELVELDRASCCGAGRHRRAQPGARRHAERAHVRARPAGRRRRADDEHLLDVPGRADRVPGAPRRERGLPRARQPAPRATTASPYEKGLTNKNLLWLLVEDMGLDELKSRVKRPLTDLRVGPFYGCYIVRPTDRLGIDRDHPRDTYLHQVIDGARRRRSSSTPASTSAAASRSSR